MSRPSLPAIADKFNVMIIGDDNVGKTSILERYGTGIFQTEHKKTHGIRDYNKEYTLNEKVYLFKLWDTAGQEKFIKSSKAFYKKADCIMIVCAINNKESFTNVTKWIKNIDENSEINSIHIILISNKCDLEDERQVGLDEIRQKAEELQIEYYETSALTGYGIDDSFQAIFKKAINEVYKNDVKDIDSKDKELEKEEDTSSFKNGCWIY